MGQLLLLSPFLKLKQLLSDHDHDVPGTALTDCCEDSSPDEPSGSSADEAQSLSNSIDPDLQSGECSTPTHKWIPLLYNCFYICVVCRHTSLLDLKQVLTQDITHQV